MAEGAPAVEQSLTELVWDLLDAESELSDGAKFAIIGALESDDALREQVDGTAAPATRPDSERAELVEPLGAYLKSVTVAGFRGIGPRAVLDVSPCPGITVVSGRNGSGKSSFAEALEFALTGQSYRWSKKSKIWASSWRNLHEGQPCEIRVEFAVPESKPLTVGVDWTDGAKLTEGATWTQAAGSKRQPGTATLGWSSALETYRPILTYDEIGGLLDQEPKKLYDALATILSLEEIYDAEKRLETLHSERKQPRLHAARALKDVVAVLGEAEDSRAADVAGVLKKNKQPDLEAVARLVSGADSPQAAALSKLREIAEVPVPGFDETRAITSALRQSLSRRRGLADYTLDIVERRTELLRLALEFRGVGTSDECPVCGEGTLDDAWQHHTQEFLDAQGEQLAEYRRTKEDVDSASGDARDLVKGLVDVTQVDRFTLTSMPAYSRAIADARDLPDDLDQLSDHLDRVMPIVVGTLIAMQAEATAAADALDDAWSPIAAEINTWLSHEQAARLSDDTLNLLDNAKKWVVANAKVLRNERIRPITENVREIWSQLRQESDVDIDSITLLKVGNNRKAVLSGSIDGQPAEALTVMSQGELHALALALFIPRATAQASPFRFIVLDDPIQAMDPAKIEGFIDVLRSLAQTRQVIVFSHDDRLAASIRHLGVPAQLLEVTRESGSTISVRAADNPAKRYASDAFALVADENVDEEIKRRAAPGLFRLALESAAQQVFYAKRAASGDSRDAFEATWEAHKKTNQRIALAVHGDASGDISGWRRYRQYRAPALAISNKGSHGTLTTLTKADVSDLHKTVDDILAGQ